MSKFKDKDMDTIKFPDFFIFLFSSSAGDVFPMSVILDESLPIELVRTTSLRSAAQHFPLCISACFAFTKSSHALLIEKYGNSVSRMTNVI